MSLADELLADLEENDHEDGEDEDEAMETEEQAVEVKEEKPDIKQLQMEIDTTQIQSVRGTYIELFVLHYG